MSITEEIRDLVDAYARWLRDNTVLKKVNEQWVEIMTPHLDRHNDYLQIYAKKDGNRYLLTDDGYILNDLANSGCALDSPKRQELLRTTLAGFGVQMQEDQLLVHATQANFALRKHSIIQAMLAVNDLFYVAAPNVSSIFLEDVVSWMDLSDIRYTPKVKFAGKSGYDHMFDLVIPKSRQQPERIVQPINHPNKDAALSLLYKWVDTRDARPSDSRLIAVLNDTKGAIPQAVIEALRNYDAETVPWSERERVRESLAA